jgi:UDP-N-acetylglucosamine 4,6-dehydratase
MAGGEIFIPKIPSMKLVDLFETIVPGAKKEIIGIRPGEKLHELLVTPEEARHAVEMDEYFVILPEHKDLFDIETRFKYFLKKGKKLPLGFYFSSDNNKVWLSKKDFQRIINKLTLHS